jgi:hypothetical protein
MLQRESSMSFLLKEARQRRTGSPPNQALKLTEGALVNRNAIAQT